MAFPPMFEPITRDSVFNISPLTTVLWEGLNDGFDNTLSIDCNQYLNDQQARAEFQSKLSDTILNIAFQFNISEQQIFSDFIANGDSEAKARAQSIVTGLKRSLAYLTELEAQYPEAGEVRVTHYQGEQNDNLNAYPEAWYRNVVVSFRDDTYLFRIDKMEDDLVNIKRPIYYRDEQIRDWQSGTLTTTKDVRSLTGDDTPYQCSLSEQLSVTQGGVTYSLSNDEGEFTELAEHTDCVFREINDEGSRRYFDFDYRIG